VATAVGTHDSIRAYVYGVAVDPSRRRRAVGTAMIGELERRYRRLGFERVYSLVLRDDEGAMAFCRSLGYSEFNPPSIYRYRTTEYPDFVPPPDDVELRTARPDDVDEIVDLWVRCDLIHDPARARAEALTLMRTFPTAFSVGVMDGRIVAVTCSTTDMVQTWGYRHGVEPGLRRGGYGRAVAQHAREQSPFLADMDWHGGIVLADNELALGYGRARGHFIHTTEWAYMRKRLEPRN
jgi:ribosomal protein S18 acetylase RimI-like enzyme